jgi:hypothetical protein
VAGFSDYPTAIWLTYINAVLIVLIPTVALSLIFHGHWFLAVIVTSIGMLLMVTFALIAGWAKGYGRTNGGGL